MARRKGRRNYCAAPKRKSGYCCPAPYRRRGKGKCSKKTYKRRASGRGKSSYNKFVSKFTKAYAGQGYGRGLLQAAAAEWTQRGCKTPGNRSTAACTTI